MEALLQHSKLRFGAIPFDKIKVEDFVPALDKAIAQAEKDIEVWKKNSATDFNSVLVKLDEPREQIGYISTIFYNLHSAHCPDDLQKIAPEISSKLTKFGNDITLDPIVFQRVKACWDSKDSQKLTMEELTILEKTYKGFVRNGALLDEKSKTRLRELDESLAKISLEYSQNVLKATNDYKLVITNKDDLEGLPESVIEAAAEMAEKKGHKGSWVFTLDYPMLVPFLTYSKKRDLRKKLFMANSSKSFGGQYDNQENVLSIVKLRHERAHLLGYPTHAHYVLEERMAASPEKVMGFLSDLQHKAMPQAKNEFERLSKLALELDGLKSLERWDGSFYSEILKQREIELDEEALRPFFQLDNVIDGIFQVTGRLYNLKFTEIHELPKYHEDVKIFEVHDEKKNAHIGLFYMDFHPRETKRGGAWMTSFVDQGLQAGVVKRPHVGIVCNFTKPTKTKPSLLSLDEVTTLYHEFGHALHGLLSQCQYTTLSGTSVFWDFVELPSQVMENWVMEKEVLDLFAVHYETGEKIPVDMIQKIKKAGNFLEGMGTLRQLSFALLDMSYHAVDPTKIKSVSDHENKISETTSLYPKVEGTNMSCSFSHIFAGGYSAGYYSYKWAEVLDADAFEFFKEKGIFDAEVANRFRENILEKGGTEHPMELYKKFRGKEPSVDALLRRAGLAT